MFRFGLFGIPVTVQWWFWLSAALLSGVIGMTHPDAVFMLLTWMVVVFISVLWHEMGHALAFRRYGFSTEIVLRAFGGYTAPLRGGRLARDEDIIVTGAGPAFGFALWFVIYGLMRLGVIPSTGEQWGWGIMGPASSLPDFVRWGLVDLQMANFWWSILNLIPVAPLDGGRILSAAMGPGRMRQALMISVVCGGIVTLGAFAMGQLFLAILIGWMTFENVQRMQGSFRYGRFS